LLAVLIANEWENQDEVLKQHALPTVRVRARHGLRDRHRWRLGQLTA
jgi:hypothetical protein